MDLKLAIFGIIACVVAQMLESHLHIVTVRPAHMIISLYNVSIMQKW